MGWTIHREHFNVAVKELGLKWPVRVRISECPPADHVNPSELPKNGTTVGFSSIDDDEQQPRHVIWMYSLQPASQAGRTLWHELRHARDLELTVAKFGFDGTQVLYRTEKEMIPYENRPVEQRAQEMEGCALTYPLIERT